MPMKNGLLESDSEKEMSKTNQSSNTAMNSQENCQNTVKNPTVGGKLTDDEPDHS